MIWGRQSDGPTVPWRTRVLLMAFGAVGAVALSVVLYDGEVVFPALLGACFGLAVAATGQRRLRIGVEDIRARRVRAHYSDGDTTVSAESGKAEADTPRRTDP